MVAAVAMFAAAACVQDIENDVPETTGETVVYTAAVDGADTKAALNETTKKSEWVANDAITVHDGTKGWTFTTAAAGANVEFSNNEGFGEYRPVIAVYPTGEYTADVANKTVQAVIPTDQQAQVGTYHDVAALAVAYTENSSFSFKNAHALLKFTVDTDNVTHVIFHGNLEEPVTGVVSVKLGADGVETVTCEDKTYAKCYAWHDEDHRYFEKGETYYLAVAPQVFNSGITVKIQINEGEEKVVRTTDKKVTIKPNTILNLGELKYVAPETVSTVYLKPGIWDQAGAWFSAHFYNSIGGAADVKMTDSDSDGIYEAAVPSGMENVIFCRMNGEYTEFGWDVTEGEGEDFTVLEDHVWNQSGNEALPLAGDIKVYYNVTDWTAGEWADTPQESTPEDTKTYGICGDLTEWSKDGTIPDVPMELVDGKYVAYNVKFEKTGGFKIRANNEWADSDNWGLSAAGAVEVGKFYDVITGAGSGDLSIISGTYDIWFDLDKKVVYIMKPGASIDTAAKGTPIAPSSDVWYLIGEFNTWKLADQDYKFANEAGWFVLKNCNLSKSGGLKINNGTWGVQRTGSIGLYASCALSSSGSDFYLPKGEYDIYMDAKASKVYVLLPGETPETNKSYRLYIKNSTGQLNVVIHAWGGYSTSWPGEKLTKTDDVEGYGSCSYLELKKGANPIVNFLIHNGDSGNKTADQNCSSLTVLPTGDLYFEWKK